MSVRPRILALPLATLVAWAGLAGCGDAYRFETNNTGAPKTQAAGGGGLPPFLDLVATAKDATAFRGVRRVRSVRTDGVVETREDVGANGSGDFAIELLETLSLPPGVDSVSFPLAHESAARFQWQVRDFRLRDLARASTNYSIVVLPATPVVAGITCARVEFHRAEALAGRPGRYEVDVDPRTGFVLRCREFDATGRVVYESEYESFTYGGDVDDMVLRGRTFAAQPLDLSGDLDQQAGTVVLMPDVLPEGFELVSGEVMDVPSTVAIGQSAILRSGDWVRFVATDGIETVTFVHRETTGPQLVATGEMKMIRQGGWEIGYGEIAGTSYAVAGRVSREALRQLVQSAF